jgi:predicted aspartyl protease
VTIRFRYKRFWIGEHQSLRFAAARPIIPIRLKVASSIVQYEALLDTGADQCIFDGQIADILGINLQDGPRFHFGGITGQDATAFLHPVAIVINGFEIETTIGFSNDISLGGYGILGQDGFFDHFTVIFDRSAETVELRPKPKH